MSLFDWNPRLASPSFAVDVPIDNSVSSYNNQETYSTIYSPTSSFVDSRQLTINVNSPNAITKKADRTTPTGASIDAETNPALTNEQEGSRPNFRLPDFNLFGGNTGTIVLIAGGIGAYYLLTRNNKK